MDAPDRRLVAYPFIVVRVGCLLCARSGSYRLARLAHKYGPHIGMDELLSRLTADCAARKMKATEGFCQARFIDLDPPALPPDLPRQKLRVVAGGKR